MGGQKCPLAVGAHFLEHTQDKHAITRVQRVSIVGLNGRLICLKAGVFGYDWPAKAIVSMAIDSAARVSVEV